MLLGDVSSESFLSLSLSLSLSESLNIFAINKDIRDSHLIKTRRWSKSCRDLFEREPKKQAKEIADAKTSLLFR